MTLKILRYRISVQPSGAGWQVTISDPAGNPVGGARAPLRRGTAVTLGDFPYPPAGEPMPALLCDPAGNFTADVLDEVYDKFNRRGVTQVQSELYGRYLFETLLGSAVDPALGTSRWQAVLDGAAAAGADVIELALCWPLEENAFHALHWEAMHDGQNFVASAARTPVAITRLVPTGQAVAAPARIKPPIRVLFAVGTTLSDRQIRPAAEYFGIMRRLRIGNRDLSLYSRMLQNASAVRVQDAVANFAPHVVHFISHGMIDDQGPYLMLAQEEGEKDERLRRRYGAGLLKLLATANGYPPVVVLSACYSAGAGDRANQLMTGAEAAPLAAQLVSGQAAPGGAVPGGVPVVIGMSGQVADLACRLFTRKFCEALIAGHPLVVATAKGRWAAFATGLPLQNWVDWAFPVVFLAESVPPEYTPVDLSAGNPNEQIETWIDSLGLKREPVFCGREDIFDEYYKMWPPRPDGPAGPGPTVTPNAVLVVSAPNRQPGLGRSRLLSEIAMQSLRDGHLPILVGSDSKNWQPPKDPLELAYRIYKQCLELRDEDRFDLPAGRPSQVEMLWAYKDDPKTLAQPAQVPALADRIRTVVGSNPSKIPNQAIKIALQLDLADLIGDARRQYPTFFTSQSRTVVLLLRVEEYDAALSVLVDDDDGPNSRWLRPTGLGTAREPVPVVMVYSRSGSREGANATDQNVDPFESRVTELEFRRAELCAFRKEADEDALIYQQVLLNPTPLRRQKPLVINPDIGERWRLYFLEHLRDAVQGIPANFNTSRFVQEAETAIEFQILLEGADYDVKLPGNL